ncbi:hypothetical protein M5K25_023363 [Dendrobium thyrsiflorum]|uniref:Uncharacterized protein n=1 Tax=Dendrobium thyrsiflorum TaxID=117978 RepID=A0ABD0U7X2_DENTH
MAMPRETPPNCFVVFSSPFRSASYCGSRTKRTGEDGETVGRRLPRHRRRNDSSGHCQQEPVGLQKPRGAHPL